MALFVRIGPVILFVTLLAALAEPAKAADVPPAPAPLPKEAVDFFEAKVRPVLLDKCYNCHDGSGVKAVKGGFTLNTRDGLLKGGESGKPAVVPGKPAESRLITAIKWTDEHLKMPPKQEHRLTAEQIGDLEKWVAIGAPDPRTGGAVAATNVDAAKSHWAFQKPREPAVPAVKKADWVRSPIDAFVLAKLEAKELSPAPQADKRALIRRATFDLTGLPPTPEEVAAFEADSSADAFAKVVDRLLASPAYGERWGRFWLDVARYADTKGYVFEEERRFPFSYTYRDWVIRAFNEDLPYDQFLVQQIAADRLKLDDKRPLAAMGFLTIGRRFLNNQADIIDDRIDVVTRGTMALTVQCARCHDHKFDPIPTADYYSLYGVFASSQEPAPADLPVIGSAEKTEKYAAFEKELAKKKADVDNFLKKQHDEALPKLRSADGIKAYLAAVYEFEHQGEKDRMDERRFGFARDLSGFVLGRWRGFLNSKKDKHDPVVAPWIAYAAIPPAEFAAKAKEVTEKVVDKAPADKPIHPLVAAKFAGKPPADIGEVAQRYGELLASFDKPDPLPDAQQEALRQVLRGDGTPTNIAVADADKLLKRDTRNTLRDLQRKVEALQANNPDAPPRAMALVDSPSPTNPRILVRGNPANPGAEVPRQFLSILSGGKREPFKDGSGRLELARAIASPENPLTARVMVNRVWAWHFGQGLVRTPSDFGLRSDPPTHPELLDYLALRFVENKWSIKQLHRLIMLSATYQEGSEYNAAAHKVDPENTLLWRHNRRRLEFESMRDSMLAVSGKLDRTVGGRPADITGDSANPRRTVYGFIDRQNLPGMFRAFDFASPDTHSPQRFTTTVPQQALFMMNSPFAVNQAKALVARPEVAQESEPSKRVENLYRLLFGRSPTAEEIWAAADFLRGEEASASPGTPSKLTPWEKYAQVLLESNEFVFVD